MRLLNKTAIVTGGGSGFGTGICEKFAREGARVIVADVNGDSAEKIAKDLNVSSFKVDVSNSKSMAELANFSFNEFGNIDIIVNNAGVTHLPAPMEDISEDEFDRVLNVNIRSIYLAAKYFVPHMKNNKSGVILNIASTAGVSPRPNLNWYNASKGWVITATKAMAIELASFGVRVNALNPVAGETPLLKAFMGEDTPEMRKKFLSTIPLGRFSTPEDLGSAACYLCSDEASLITGIAMEIDGGRCI
ncbi:MAG: 3-oxoacyl-[acyl-carrier protein] reductase [Paracoccaceae bacterium]|jgi:3-oxoacyl-[acyl-carrier protein] reductase